MRNFQGYFSMTFQDLKLQFPGLSRSWNFQEKKSRTFQDFPGGVGTLSYTLVAHETRWTEAAMYWYRHWLVGLVVAV